MLKCDLPRTGVPAEHLKRQRTADALPPDNRCNPETDDRSAIVFQPADNREPDRSIITGVRMGTPGQVTGRV